MDITNPAAVSATGEGGVPVQINSAATAPTEVPKSVDGLGTTDHVDNSLNGNPGGLEGILNQQPDETNNIGGLAAQDAVSAPVAPGPGMPPATPPSEVTAPGVEVLPNSDGQAPEAALGVLGQTAEQLPPPPGSPLPPPPVGEALAAPLTPPDSTLGAPPAPAMPDMASPPAMPEPPVIDASAPSPVSVEAPMPPAAEPEGEMTEEQIIEEMDNLYQQKEQSNMKDAEIDQKLRDLWEKYKTLQQSNPDQGIEKVA